MRRVCVRPRLLFSLATGNPTCSFAFHGARLPQLARIREASLIVCVCVRILSFVYSMCARRIAIVLAEVFDMYFWLMLFSAIRWCQSTKSIWDHFVSHYVIDISCIGHFVAECQFGARFESEG